MVRCLINFDLYLASGLVSYPLHNLCMQLPLPLLTMMGAQCKCLKVSIVMQRLHLQLRKVMWMSSSLWTWM